LLTSLNVVGLLELLTSLNVVGLLELLVSVTGVLVHTAAQQITKSKQALK